jgi:hypothetical protein
LEIFEGEKSDQQAGCQYWGSVIRSCNYGKLREDSICDYDHVKWASAMLFVYFIVTLFVVGESVF